MSQAGHEGTQEHVEQLMGNLLRIGVISAAAVVLLGGILFLHAEGAKPADHRIFQGEPAELRSPSGIIAGVLARNSPAIIQLGVLLLIATPVARVVFTVYAFARQRDWRYVVITLIVLTILLYSLFSEAVE